MQTRFHPIRGILRTAVGLAIVAAVVLTSSDRSWAVGGLVGSIHGTVIDKDTKAPIADAKVSATSGSGGYTTHSDSHGFFSLLGVPSDTYTITISKAGYQPAQYTGITVVGDQSLSLGTVGLAASARVLSTVTVRGTSNSAFQPKQTQDVTTLSGARIAQALGSTNNASEATLVLAAPGAVSDINGNISVRGSLTVELANQFDGVPFDAPFFDENGSQGLLNNPAGGTGGSLQLVSGAGDATQGNVGAGIINIVPSRGTYPAKGEMSLSAESPYYNHGLNFDYGFATPDTRYSNYFSVVARREVPQYAPYGVDASTIGQFTGTSFIKRDDLMDNFYYKFGRNLGQQVQVLARWNDYQSLGNYGGTSLAQWYTSDPNYQGFWSNINSIFGVPAPYGPGPSCGGNCNFAPSGPGSFASLEPLFPGVPVGGGHVNQPELTAYQPMHFLKIGYSNNLNSTTYFNAYFFNWGLTDGSTNYTVGSNTPGFAEIGGSHVGGIAELQHQFGQNHQVTLAWKLDNAYPEWTAQDAGLQIFALFLSQFQGVGPTYVPTLADWYVPADPNKLGQAISSTNPCVDGTTDGMTGCYIYNYMVAKGLWNGSLPRIPTMGINYHHTDFHQYGVGLRDQWSVSSRLKLDYGIRVDAANNSFGPNYFALDPFGNPSDVNPITQIGTEFTHPKFWEPRFAAAYQLGDNDSLRVSYGRSVEFFFAQTSGTPAGYDSRFWNSILFAIPPKDGLAGSPGPGCGSGWHGPGAGYAANPGIQYAGQGTPYFFPCQSYASQLFWTWDQFFDAPDLGGNGPPTYNDYDLEWSHQFTHGKIAGWAMKIGAFARRGYNVEQNTLLAFGPPNPVTGQTSASTFATQAKGVEKVTGIEAMLTTPDVRRGFSGFVSLNYVNELLNTPPVAGSDVLPILNAYLFNSGLMFRSGFLSPFSGAGGVTYTAPSGLKITPTISFNEGYPFGVGRTSIGFINGVLQTLPETNFGIAAPFAGPNGPGFPYNASYYVDPAYPGSYLNPNIAASRGYGEPALAGGNLSRPAAIVNVTFEQPLKNGLSVGMNVINVFNNHNGVPTVNGFWQPVATGVGGPQTGLVPGAYPGNPFYNAGARDAFAPAGGYNPFESGYNAGTVWRFYITSKF